MVGEWLLHWVSGGCCGCLVVAEMVLLLWDVGDCGRKEAALGWWWRWWLK